MTKKQWYETLFENYARQYEEEVFAQGTPGECDFMEKELGFDKSLQILDVGCGIKIEIFGAKLGAFSREDKLTTEDFEMLVIAQK